MSAAPGRSQASSHRSPQGEGTLSTAAPGRSQASSHRSPQGEGTLSTAAPGRSQASSHRSPQGEGTLSTAAPGRSQASSHRSPQGEGVAEPCAGTQRAADGACDVVCFWRAAHADWFSHDAAFDHRFRERFLGHHLAAVRHEYDDWADTPEGALALLILLDQFPHNAFRGTKRMFATDTVARQIALNALSAGHMDAVDADLRLFFCLPFSHSEHADDQDLSVALNVRLGQPWLAHALGHRDIIRRFGRFPHRNPILGRVTTSEEQAFLDQGGFAG